MRGNTFCMFGRVNEGKYVVLTIILLYYTSDTYKGQAL